MLQRGCACIPRQACHNLQGMLLGAAGQVGAGGFSRTELAVEVGLEAQHDPPSHPACTALIPLCSTAAGRCWLRGESALPCDARSLLHFSHKTAEPTVCLHS